MIRASLIALLAAGCLQPPPFRGASDAGVDGPVGIGSGSGGDPKPRGVRVLLRARDGSGLAISGQVAFGASPPIDATGSVDSDDGFNGDVAVKVVDAANGGKTRVTTIVGAKSGDILEIGPGLTPPADDGPQTDAVLHVTVPAQNTVPSPDRVTIATPCGSLTAPIPADALAPSASTSISVPIVAGLCSTSVDVLAVLFSQDTPVGTLQVIGAPTQLTAANTSADVTLGSTVGNAVMSPFTIVASDGNSLLAGLLPVHDGRVLLQPRADRLRSITSEKRETLVGEGFMGDGFELHVAVNRPDVESPVLVRERLGPANGMSATLQLTDDALPAWVTNTAMANGSMTWHQTPDGATPTAISVEIGVGITTYAWYAPFDPGHPTSFTPPASPFYTPISNGAPRIGLYRAVQPDQSYDTLRPFLDSHGIAFDSMTTADNELRLSDVIPGVIMLSQTQ